MKILVVDDEILIREWLLFCLKGNPDVDIVGCAANGEQAMAMVQNLAPDVVLTDIKMPVMDGIELLKKIKEFNEEITVILLTAYNEFEYARQAIREGAREYMLKTEISNESLNEMLKKIVRDMPTPRINSTPMENAILIKKILLKEDKINSEDIVQLENFGIRQTGGYYSALAYNNFGNTIHLIIPSSNNIIITNITLSDSMSVLIIHINTYTQADAQKYLQQSINELFLRNHYAVGVSSVISDITQLNEIVGNALVGLSKNYYQEGTIFKNNLQYSKIIESRHEWEYRIKQYIQDIYRIIGKEQLISFNKAMDQIEQAQCINIDYIRYFCLEMVDLFNLRYPCEIEDSRRYLTETKEKVNCATKFDEMRNIVSSFAKDHLLSEEIDEEKCSRNISNAISYIRSHYSEPISLSQIAEYVNLNPEYFSRIFKEETNMTYSTFLSNIRLAKAESMLVNSNSKVFEIAEAVGYPNVSYFSTVFKKKYGLNPYEFRRENESNMQ